MDDIADWRSCIDKIDGQVLKLLNERARCACGIGRIKAEKAMKIHNPAREREIIKRLIEQNDGPLTDEAIQSIFKQIIVECRSLEKIKNDKV